jgi:hypothetical protein
MRVLSVCCECKKKGRGKICECAGVMGRDCGKDIPKRKP